MEMTQAKAERLLREFHKRKINKPKFVDDKFVKQAEFINSKAKLKAVQCTRRAGKSYGAGLYAFKEAYENAGVSVVIIGLTRESIKKIFFKDILSQINKQYNLRCKKNKSDLTFTLPNGSVIYLVGVNAKPDDMDKLLGQKNKLVVIDEAAFYSQDMNKLVYEVLEPSIVDYDGTICMISTTSALSKGLYYEVVNGEKSGWEVFKWTSYDNPYMIDNFTKKVNELIADDPLVVLTPSFRRMYKNEWVHDLNLQVYKFSEKNLITAMPLAKYNYVLGVDLGFNDDTAFVVCAYSDNDPRLYVVDSFKESGMIVSDVAKKVKELDKTYNFDTYVVDNASKQVVEELKLRYNIPFIGAEKQGKKEYIELLNSDLIVEYIKVMPKGKALIEEWRDLIWDEKILEDKKKYVERANCANHLSDAFLYAWRWCFNYSSKPKINMELQTEEDKVDEFWETEGAKLEALQESELQDAEFY